MARNIFRARMDIDEFADGCSRLFIEFADTKGQERGSLQWTPVWSDVSQLMVKAVEVERLNKPGSTHISGTVCWCLLGGGYKICAS